MLPVKKYNPPNNTIGVCFIPCQRGIIFHSYNYYTMNGLFWLVNQGPFRHHP